MLHSPASRPQSQAHKPPEAQQACDLSLNSFTKYLRGKRRKQTSVPHTCHRAYFEPTQDAMLRIKHATNMEVANALPLRLQAGSLVNWAV